MKTLQIVEQALATEAVPSLPIRQFHVSHFGSTEFLQFLKSEFKECDVLLVHDSVLKKCPRTFAEETLINEVATPAISGLGISGQDFANFLNNQELKVESVNLENVLLNSNTSENSLHASAKHIPTLKGFFQKQFELKNNSTKKAVFVFGSGTVTDLCKHALYELINEFKDKTSLANLDIQFVCFPTALTVTAFTSHFSVLDYGGAKRTKPSLMPHKVFWVNEVLQNAPLPLVKAGYGDLLARFVAYGDWYLAYEFGVAARYDELAFRLMEPFTEFLKNVAPEFKNPILSEESISTLSECLSMAGIAMSVSGETTPLSGFEHVISHGLDFLNLQNNSSEHEMPLHGEQVALGTLISARCFEEFVNSPSPLPREFAFLTEDRMQDILKKMLKQGLGLAGTFSEENLDKQFVEIWNEYSKKHQMWLNQKEKREHIVEKLPEIKEYLKKLVLPYETIQEIFENAQMPFSPEDLSPPQSADKLRWAVRFSPFVRARASLADILFWLSLDPALVAAV